MRYLEQFKVNWLNFNHSKQISLSSTWSFTMPLLISSSKTLSQLSDQINYDHGVMITLFHSVLFVKSAVSVRG